MGIIQLSTAQLVVPAAEVEAKSLQLYTEGRWKDLITYGNEKLNEGIDFPLLQMRLGYANFMLKNFAQSIIHYQKVSTLPAFSGTARYYLYLNNLYLNNREIARYYSSKLSSTYQHELQLQPFTLSEAEAEISYKSPDNSRRLDAQYYRVGVGFNLGYHLNIKLSGALFNQTIDEPAMGILGVRNSRNIVVNQKEFYAKLTATVSGKLQLLGGYHYVYTPFNNLEYINQIGFAGLQVATPYLHVKAVANFATLSNQNYRQYDGSLTWYPMGNTNLYSITKASYNDNFITSQIIGLKVAKNSWLEANTTIGEYINYLDNDALYLYNDIDTKQFKIGASLYTKLSKRSMFSINYTYDRKKLFNQNILFNQHSITGGIKWTL